MKKSLRFVPFGSHCDIRDFAIEQNKINFAMIQANYLPYVIQSRVSIMSSVYIFITFYNLDFISQICLALLFTPEMTFLEMTFLILLLTLTYIQTRGHVTYLSPHKSLGLDDVGRTDVRTASPECPASWHYFQSSADEHSELCYHLYKYKMAHADAVSLCAQIGGSLSTPKSSDQNDRITSLANQSAAWIGLNDIRSEGTFVWSDHRALDYNDWTYWASDQPNNRKNSEHCVTVNFQSKRWYDSDCALKRYVICQVDYHKAHYTCDVEEPPENAQHNANTSTVPVGGLVVYRCNHGYDSVSGPTRRFCLINGKLSGKPFNSCLQLCPPGWSRSPLGGYCLRGYTHSQKYGDAKRKCQEMGAYLAEPRTANLNTFTAAVVPDRHAWIGLTDLQTEGRFLWESDSGRVNFTHWSKYSPNNRDGKEHCVEIDLNGEWNDKYCNSPLSYICQIDMRLTRSKCAVELVENGNSLTNSSYVSLDISISYACNDDYTALSGSEIRMCMIDGRLSGTPLRCSPSCPDGWTISPRGDHCYIYHPDLLLNHDKAVEYCKNISGTLPMPKNAEDNARVSGLGVGELDIWLGLKDVFLNKTFVWEDGNGLSWTAWSHAHPLDKNIAACVSLRPRDGTWCSHNCLYSRNVICQKSIYAARSVCPVEGITNGTISSDAELVSLGESVSYTCGQGFVAARGDSVRSCTSYGWLSGEALVCVESCSLGLTMSPLGAFCFQVADVKVLSIQVRDIDQGQITRVINGCYQLEELK